MGDPGRARHRLPRPGGPSPGAGRARPGAGVLTRRIRALPDGAMSTLTWDQGSEMARHQRQGRRHREPGVFFAHPHSPWERDTNENTNRHRGPLPAQRHPHHQPPTPTRAPSPTNSTTAPAPPSTTPPHKKHSPNSLPPPLDTTHSQPQPCPRRTVASACAVEPTASEAPAPCPPRGRDGAGAQRLERSVRAVRPRCQQSSDQMHGHAARRRGSRDQWTAPAAACPVVGGLAHLEADTRTLRVADTSGCRLTFTV